MRILGKLIVNIFDQVLKLLIFRRVEIKRELTLLISWQFMLSKQRSKFGTQIVRKFGQFGVLFQHSLQLELDLLSLSKVVRFKLLLVTILLDMFACVAFMLPVTFLQSLLEDLLLLNEPSVSRPPFFRVILVEVVFILAQGIIFSMQLTLSILF